MTKTMKWITLVNSLMIAALAVLLLLSVHYRERTAYVNLNALFNGFNYKTVAEKEFDRTMTSRKSLLDSLEMAIISAQNSNDTARARKLGNLYYQKQAAFEQESEKLSNEMTSRVWAQLTQYLADYSKSENLTYLFGTKGDGSLMYAGEGKDVTDALLIYVNKCYEDDK